MRNNFDRIQEVKEKSADDLLKLQEQMQNLKTEMEESEQKIKELDGVIAELEKKRDKVRSIVHN